MSNAVFYNISTRPSTCTASVHNPCGSLAFIQSSFLSMVHKVQIGNGQSYLTQDQ